METDDLVLILLHGSDTLLKKLSEDASFARVPMAEIAIQMEQIAKVFASATYSTEEFINGLVRFGTASIFDDEQ